MSTGNNILMSQYLRTKKGGRGMDTTEFWEVLRSGEFISMVKESSRGQSLNNSREVFNVFRPMVEAHIDVEVIYGIFLDVKNHTLKIEELAKGSIISTTIYPREVIKKIIEHKAASLVLVHNHPSGDPTPSDEDFEITRRIVIVLYAMGVAVHDHIIIGDTTYYSMADSGIMTSMLKRIKENIK